MKYYLIVAVLILSPSFFTTVRADMQAGYTADKGRGCSDACKQYYGGNKNFYSTTKNCTSARTTL